MPLQQHLQQSQQKLSREIMSKLTNRCSRQSERPLEAHMVPSPQISAFVESAESPLRLKVHKQGTGQAKPKSALKQGTSRNSVGDNEMDTANFFHRKISDLPDPNAGFPGNAGVQLTVPKTEHVFQKIVHTKPTNQ